jgi:uncharacterized LabA/DUF88 family protein
MKDKRSKTLPNYAFIDSQNVNLGVRSMGWRLNFKRFRNYLTSKYNIEKAFLFIGYIPGNEMLYYNLQQSGYIVIFKPTLEFHRKKQREVKGNVDAELVLHTIVEWDNYKKAIIVSGDGDFYCLVKYLEQNQKLLKIIVPNSKYSSLLRDFAKYILKIATIKSKVRE